MNSREARREAADRSRHSAARYNDLARYFGIMDGIAAAVLGRDGATTTPPQPPVGTQPHVEWSRSLQAANRLIRAYLDGEPLEGWALDLLAADDASEVDRLLDSIGRSLLDELDAAVLRSELQLKAYVADPGGSRLRQDAMFAIGLALDERRGKPPVIAKSGPAVRVIANQGLPVTVVGEGAGALRVDGRALDAKQIADSERHAGRAQFLRAEIAAVGGDRSGLRTLEVEVESGDGRIALLRHSVPIAPDQRLLGREVFDAGFRVRTDGSGADLPSGGTGQPSLPRMADGQSNGFVDLCFAGDDGSAAAQATRRDIGHARRSAGGNRNDRRRWVDDREDRAAGPTRFRRFWSRAAGGRQ
jgi:hypothetical protein